MRLPPLAAVPLLAALLLGPSAGPVAAVSDVVVPTSSLAAAPRTTKVVIVTLDAVGSNAVRRLGRDGMPTLHRLIRQGASTRNARTAHETTLTLPNHTSIVTGRRVEAARGGHGVWWNDERVTPRTVQDAAGHRVSSVFSAVGSALFTSKEKLLLFERSWPKGVDRFVVNERNARLTRMARADLVEHRRALTFLHLSLPDDVGHEHGFSSPEFDVAASTVDRLLGRIVTTIEARPRLRDHLTLIVTADHGSAGSGHYDPTEEAFYRVPFVVWGAGVEPGADLYDLNPGRVEPRANRPGYDEEPPIRNTDLASLVTTLLGHRAVPGGLLPGTEPLRVH